MCIRDRPLSKRTGPGPPGSPLSHSGDRLPPVAFALRAILLGLRLEIFSKEMLPVSSLQNPMQAFDGLPIRQAVFRQIFPAVASQMITLIYNLADTYFCLLYTSISMAVPSGDRPRPRHSPSSRT